MSGVRIELNRLNVSVAGVSSLIVEDAMDGLRGALMARLAASPLKEIVGASVPRLVVGPINVRPGVSATALRSIIAERLLEAVVRVGGGSD